MFTCISTVRSEAQLRAALRKPHVFYAPTERRSLADVVRGWMR